MQLMNAIKQLSNNDVQTVLCTSMWHRVTSSDNRKFSAM